MDSRTLFNVSPADRKELLYSGSSQEHLCIGHLRGDFGKSGKEFWTSWWPHAAHEHNTENFKTEFDALVGLLNSSMLASRTTMSTHIRQHPSLLLDHGAVGYLITSDKYRYYVRCSPEPGDYNFYIYCYLKEE